MCVQIDLALDKMTIDLLSVALFVAPEFLGKYAVEGVVTSHINLTRYFYSDEQRHDVWGFRTSSSQETNEGESCAKKRASKRISRRNFPNLKTSVRHDACGFTGDSLGRYACILPGGGAVLASFVSYALEKKVKMRPGEIPFGKGNIRGVASPESANNAASQTAFIPLLTLGIPPNAVMALMVGAMIIHDIQPGPQVMTGNPELFWGLIVSMWIGNLMLVILNLPLIGMWIKLLTVPYRFLFPAIVLLCAIGVCFTNHTFDIWMVGIFGFIGYLFSKLGCEAVPLLLGFILGPMMEEYMRRALLLSRGDWSTFVTRPLSVGLLAAAVLLLLIVLLPAVKKSVKRHLPNNKAFFIIPQ
jgi:TctA family transporter